MLMTDTKLTPSERREYLQRVPWITWNKKGQPCQGKRYSAMPLRGRDDPKYQCKNSAHWTFLHMKGGDGRNRGRRMVYCMPHLFSLGLYGSMAEEARLKDWRREQGL